MFMLALSTQLNAKEQVLPRVHYRSQSWLYQSYWVESYIGHYCAARCCVSKIERQRRSIGTGWIVGKQRPSQLGLLLANPLTRQGRANLYEFVFGIGQLRLS